MSELEARSALFYLLNQVFLLCMGKKKKMHRLFSRNLGQAHVVGKNSFGVILSVAVEELGIGSNRLCHTLSEPYIPMLSRA